MQLYKQNKIQLVSLFIAVLLFMLLMSVSFWNHSLKSNLPLGTMPILFFVLSIVALIIVYSRVLRITDPKKIESIIQKQVETERAKILTSLESADDDDESKELNIDAKIKDILPRGSYKSANSYLEKLLKSLTSEIDASLGIAYLAVKNGEQYECSSTFALPGETPPASFKPGENLNGEVARSKEIMVIEDIPEEYFQIESGLGMAKPKTLIIIPLVNNNECIALIELATFRKNSEEIQKLLIEVSKQAAEKLKTIQKS